MAKPPGVARPIRGRVNVGDRRPIATKDLSSVSADPGNRARARLRRNHRPPAPYRQKWKSASVLENLYEIRREWFSVCSYTTRSLDNTRICVHHRRWSEWLRTQVGVAAWSSDADERAGAMTGWWARQRVLQRGRCRPLQDRPPDGSSRI